MNENKKINYNRDLLGSFFFHLCSDERLLLLTQRANYFVQEDTLVPPATNQLPSSVWARRENLAGVYAGANTFFSDQDVTVCQYC